MKFNKIRSRFDTLFGRLTVLIVVVFVLSHFSWLGVLHAERRERWLQAPVDQMALQLQAFQAAMGGHLGVKLPDLMIETTDPPAGDASSASDKSAELIRQLARRLPSDTQLRLEAGPTPHVFVHLPQRNRWIAMPLMWVYAPPAISVVVPGVMVVLAIAVTFSLFTTWQIQRPVRELADTADALARRRYVPPLKERGPYELCQLAKQSNHMAADLSVTDEECNTMPVGITCDLKTPLSRLRLRIEVLTNQKVGAGIGHDVEFMSTIVEQFLAYARNGDSEARGVSVDRHLRGLVQSLVEQSKHVTLDLYAGDRFRFESTHLERIVVNLFDSAFICGVGPVNVRTSADETGYTPTMEDHDTGIPVANSDRVTRPFARLDPARDGNAHCGFGLVIVDRLVRHLGGDLTVGPTAADVPPPGSRVTMRFPVSTTTA